MAYTYIDYSKYLIDNDWKEVESMHFVNLLEMELEILFDTSNQIEIYWKGRKLKDFYITDLDSLIGIIKNIKDKTQK